MAKITYLLGAGASIDSIPIVNQFVDSIEVIIQNLEYIYKQESIVGPLDFSIHLKQAIDDLTMLLNGCKYHRSVDTFAKMLFLTSHIKENSQLYKKAKNSIVLFFELHRFFYNGIDKRYDAFIATILNHKEPRLPNDINILSWNYDYEFERAYHKYCPEKQEITDVYNDLNFTHKNSSVKINGSSQFSIVKMNGTAGFYNSKGELILGLGYPYRNVAGANNENWGRLIAPLLKNYWEYTCERSMDFKSAISFSWEEDSGGTKVIDEITKAVSDTQIFIIIGYSFPYFNRLIDKKIAASIKYGGAKVYIQDPIAEELVDTVMELKQWTAGSHGRVKTIKNCNQFYLNI